MASWKKVVLRGDNVTDEQLTLTEADVDVGSDSIAFVDSSDSSYIKRDSIVDFANAIAGDALDTDGDGVIDLSVSGLSANGIDDTTSDLVLVWDDTANAWTTASLSDVGSAGTSGVTSVTGSNGVATSAGTGAITLSLDTTTLGTESVSGSTEFVVSNSDTEGVAAASAISLGVFSNSSTNFIDRTDLSVSVASAGSANLAYNDTSGVFTYTPPDLSSYSTTDRFASAFSYTGGTTAGPTGSLTVTGGSAVSFEAIPSASASASGVVTTGAQSFSGNKTFDDNVTVSGNLTVNGDTTTVNTTNTTVTDRFISLHSGGTSELDCGIVFEGSVNKIFAWDYSAGRFGIQQTGGDASAVNGGLGVPDAYLSVVHTNSAVPTDGTNGATASLEDYGNIYVNSTTQDIYIYS